MESERERQLNEASLERARRQEPDKPLLGLEHLLRWAVDNPEEPHKLEGFTLSVMLLSGAVSVILQRQRDGARWTGIGAPWPFPSFEVLKPLQ